MLNFQLKSTAKRILDFTAVRAGKEKHSENMYGTWVRHYYAK